MQSRSMQSCIYGIFFDGLTTPQKKKKKNLSMAPLNLTLNIYTYECVRTPCEISTSNSNSRKFHAS
jgi:hypothetical protein